MISIHIYLYMYVSRHHRLDFPYSEVRGGGHNMSTSTNKGLPIFHIQSVTSMPRVKLNRDWSEKVVGKYPKPKSMFCRISYLLCTHSHRRL